jgi:hypothetical protein
LRIDDRRLRIGGLRIDDCGSTVADLSPLIINDPAFDNPPIRNRQSANPQSAIRQSANPQSTIRQSAIDDRQSAMQ